MNKKELVENIKLQLSFRNAKPLFIVENGSRAWKLDSEDSDYDVRVVYAYEPEDYLCLGELKDTFALCVDKDFNAASGDKIVYDIVGFDIKKFLKMLAKSNPTVVEWCNSPIIYYDSGFLKNKELRKLADRPNHIALYHHYSSLCKNNYLKYIVRGNHRTSKRYLYALRGLVNAMLINRIHLSSVKINKLPMDLSEAVKILDFPKTTEEEILKLIQIKREGKEKEAIERNPLLDNLIDVFLNAHTAPPDGCDLQEPRNRYLTAEGIFKRVMLP